MLIFCILIFNIYLRGKTKTYKSDAGFIIRKWENNFATVNDVFPLLVCCIKHMTLAIHKCLYEKYATENCL